MDCILWFKVELLSDVAWEVSSSSYQDAIFPSISHSVKTGLERQVGAQASLTPLHPPAPQLAGVLSKTVLRSAHRGFLELWVLSFPSLLS